MNIDGRKKGLEKNIIAMSAQQNLFERRETTKMKGIAILCIAIHNFVHTYNFVPENEFTFDLEKWKNFLTVMAEPNWNSIYHFFSFWGWCAVPIFIFLSGYGLVRKHECGKGDINVKQYIFRNFKKLFFLMLPAICYFIIMNIKYWRLESALRLTVYLSQLNNIFVNINPFNPGVYWYFGLTFQLYLFYLLYYKFKNVIFLYFSIFISVLWLYFIPDTGLLYFRHNSVAWLSIFLIGIWVGRMDVKQPIIFRRDFAFVLFFLLLFISILLNANYYTWLIIPICSLGVFVFFVRSVGNFYFVDKILYIFGVYSASIFVVHPISREILRRFPFSGIDDHVVFFTMILLLYLVITGILAFFYNKLYNWLRKRYQF